MKQLLRYVCVLLMLGACTLSPLASAASEVETPVGGGCGGAITLDGWGDAPKPDPGIKGPQGSGTVENPVLQVKPAGALPHMGDIMKQTMSIIGLLLVVLLGILFLLLKRNKTQAAQFNGYGGDDE